jgi:hypothetical protein
MVIKLCGRGQSDGIDIRSRLPHFTQGIVNLPAKAAELVVEVAFKLRPALWRERL